MSGWWLVGVVALGGLAVYLLYRALVGEPNSLTVEKIDVTLSDLPPELDGVELIHVSDLHLQGAMGDQERRVVEIVRDHPAPLLVFTGDFLEEDRALGNLVPMLMEMAKGRQAFAVFGNHDHRPSGRLQRLVPVLEGAGVVILRNEAVSLSAVDDGSRATDGAADTDGQRYTTAQRGRLWLVGIDDPVTGHSDVKLAFAHVEPGAPAIALVHSPDAAADAIAHGARLVLCGHTHGGQVNLPLIGPLWTCSRTGRRLARGLAREGDGWVYTTRGVGTSMARIRLFCPPEITIIRLRGSRNGTGGNDDGR